MNPEEKLLHEWDFIEMSRVLQREGCCSLEDADAIVLERRMKQEGYRVGAYWWMHEYDAFGSRCPVKILKIFKKGGLRVLDLTTNKERDSDVGSMILRQFWKSDPTPQ